MPRTLESCIRCYRRRVDIDPETGVCITCSRLIYAHDEGRHNERRPTPGCPSCAELTAEYRRIGYYPEN